MAAVGEEFGRASSRVELPVALVAVHVRVFIIRFKFEYGAHVVYYKLGAFGGILMRDLN